MDWVGDLLETNNPLLIQEVFQQALKHDGIRTKRFLGVCIKRWKEELPATICAEALAAAEIVAAAFGQPPQELPDSVGKLIKTGGIMPKREILDDARNVVAKIHTSSELKDFWEEGGSAHAEPWHKAVTDLEARLNRIDISRHPETGAID